MKKCVALLLIILSTQSFAVNLTQFFINREGGGQVRAMIKKVPRGIMLTLKSCSFQEISDDRYVIITNKETAMASAAILEGKSIIASDMSPKGPFLATGTWFKMSYTMDMSQFSFPDGHLPTEIKTTEVNDPIVFIDGKISSVLADLEKEAHKLCHD